MKREGTASIPGSRHEICSLKAGGMHFAAPLARILEILGKPFVQPVPLAPDFVGGVVHYRGEVLIAISLRRLLGMESASSKGDVLVFESGNGPFGLIVDAVGEVLSVSANDLEPCPSNLDSRCEALMAGAWKLPDRLLIALDPERLEPQRVASAAAQSRKGSHAD